MRVHGALAEQPVAAREMHTCARCSRAFLSAGGLERHCVEAHGGVTAGGGERAYGCGQCERRFETQDQLDVHADWHAGGGRDIAHKSAPPFFL